MNARRLLCLAFPLAFATALSLSAQDHKEAAHAAEPVAASHEHASPAAEPTHAAEHGSVPQGGAAHEGAAAHGEAAHHGPVIKLFGVTLGPTAQFGVKLFNFAIFFLILYFLLKGALSSAFKARAKEITDLLSQAERDKAEGEAQLKELEARMTGLKAELDGVMAKAEADAEAEKQRILEAAKTEASQILAQASADIDAQRRMAEAELRALVAELAVEAATARLKTRIQGEVGEKLLNRAIDQVGGAQ